MSDQIIVPAEAEPVETEPLKTQEKKFSQAELEYHLKIRLDKEKAANKKILDAREAELLALKSEKETGDTVLGKYRDSLSKLLASRMEKLPPHIKKLLDKLDPDEQIEWLNENGEQFAVKNIPGVPDGKVAGTTMEELIAKKKQSGLY